jgi:hypothetical protein
MGQADAGGLAAARGRPPPGGLTSGGSSMSRSYRGARPAGSRAELIREHEARTPGPVQVGRLAELAGVPAGELEGKTVAELAAARIIEPWPLGFELVCGQVVQVQADGNHPVAGATVNVYNTECDWLWFFPPDWPWSWGFRFGYCTTELIASRVTDSCGRFCVAVPRWDIEFVREWIQERWCFPEILRRPSVQDVLAAQGGAPAPGPGNSPDPAALARLLDGREDLAAAIGPQAVAAIRAAALNRVVGGPVTELADALAGPAFGRAVPAPVPAELRGLGPVRARAALAGRLGLRAQAAEAASEAAELDLAAPYGPFLRCIDVEVPVWVPFFSVPDISFEVTQELGGGTEVIYSGAFDVLGEPPLVNIELDANQAAVASPFPGCAPAGVVCEDEPAIVSLGYMGTDPAWLDPALGFGTLMNKPNATPDTPSTAPVCYGVPIFGCVPGAEWYRVMARFAPGSSGLVTDSAGDLIPVPSSAFGTALPVTGPPWQVWNGTTLSPLISADGDGWYSTTYLNAPWSPENLLVNWFPADGVYQLYVETGAGSPGAISVTGTSEVVPLVVDSTPPSWTLTPVSWNYVGSSEVTYFGPADDCYVINRSEQAIEVSIAYTVSATHLYSASLTPTGCSPSDVVLVSTDPAGVGYIYDGPLDNSVSGTAVYQIPAGIPDGCYSWTLTAVSRAFSPNRSSGLVENDGEPWNYVQTPVYVTPTTSIAVVTSA